MNVSRCFVQAGLLALVTMLFACSPAGAPIESPASEDDDGTPIDDDAEGDDDGGMGLDDDDGNDDADDDFPAACAPPEQRERGPLSAGVAVGDLYAPIGSSMSGYGARPGPAHPYAVMMGGSTGYYGKPDVKSLALDNGEERIVIARVAVSGVSEYLYRRVLSQICERGGVDLTGRLWLSATHSHSGPSHFTPIPVILGGVGTDVFDRPFAERLARSIADGVIESMNRMEPASLAATIVSPFDPDDTWSHDRRCHNDPPKYKEDRLFMARVDRADGSPLAALFGFPIHGVWMGKTLMSTDLPGAIERGFEDTFDRPVTTFFLQGPAGDVNPSTTPHSHDDEQGMEWHARSLAPVLRGHYDDLVPVADVALGMATRPLSISRESIGYGDDEFGRVDLVTHEFVPYADGAFYCGAPDVWAELSYFEEHGSIIDCGNPGTVLVDGYLGCVLPILFVDEWWTWAMNPTEVADVRLGDFLLALIPGELSSWLSRRLRDNLTAATGLSEDRVATFGYSNGFQGYLLTEWDWMQGGYETAMNSWGPRFGDWLVDRNVELAQTLLSAEGPEIYPEPSHAVLPLPDMLPTGYETSESPGRRLDNPAPSYRRFETVSFAWAGGFSGVDSPRVKFEKWDGDSFEPVLRSNGAAMTDGGMDTVLTAAPTPDYTTRRFPSRRLHRYAIAWELTADTPLGRYRLRVDGQSWDGAAVQPYEVVSESFEIFESDAVRVTDLSVEDLGDGDYHVSCAADWPPNPGGYRLRHPDYGSSEWAPIPGGRATATIELDGGGEEPFDLAFVDEGRFEGIWHGGPDASPIAVKVQAGSVADLYGNVGAVDLVVPIP